MIRRHPGVLMFGWLLVILVAGYAIVGHERTLREGEFVLLELTPVDPRSLLQGDYMQLGFAIDRQLTNQQQRRETRALPPYVHIVVDDQRRGRFLQVADWPAQEPNVLTLRLRRQGGQYSVGPNGYFFQEGTAERYEPARWGGFRVAANGHAMLVSLHDEGLEALGADPAPSEK
ncbi:MAG: hypothetical protein EA348_06720 [Pseudomonadaceae bacterium]|nr:MAG: hypothetical protein EA348_06720 [Pseudomonadaceae bacterium]